MSLYQNLRPKSLVDIQGNKNTVKALKKLVHQAPEIRPHSILLTGPKGCGKTTIGYILAREFGASDDSITYLNSVATGGIDDVKEVISTSHLSGLGSTIKVYIFDEAHEITRRGQSDLLAEIESPPEHCYFIFCTTDPQKMLETLRNRCTAFEVGVLGEPDIRKILDQAVDRFKLEVKPEILEAITYTSEGCPRTALVALEKVAAIEDVDMALELLVSGTDRDSSIIDLGKLLLLAPSKRRLEWKKILLTYKSIKDVEPEVLRKSLTTYLFNRMCKIDNLNGIEMAEDIARILEVLSTSVYYGGSSQLGAMLARICFMGE